MFLATAASSGELRVSILSFDEEAPPTLSNQDPIPEDLGVAGARLGIQDSVAVAKFIGPDIVFAEFYVPERAKIEAVAKQALAWSSIVLIDGPADVLLMVSDMPEAAKHLLVNVAAQGTHLRNEDCRANTLHTIPSYAMRADALMQFFVYRKWSELSLIEGGHIQDREFAGALRKAAKKFRLKFNTEKTWLFDADMRRNASREVPLFTQELGKYDVLVVADEVRDFAQYIAYNTWLPRPVAGSAGLVTSAWTPAVEQWGAAQLQQRFRELNGRSMWPGDYAAWAAIRAIAEAAIRSGSTDVGQVRAYLLSDEFELAGYKGRPLSFRAWNGQLRQPIVLTTQRALVAQAPLPGFLHQRNELDSLGLDAPESQCLAFSD